MKKVLINKKTFLVYFAITLTVFTGALVAITFLKTSSNNEFSPLPEGAKGSLPGIGTFSPELSKKLQQELHKKGPSYQPRTHHLTPDGKPKYTNRLLLETSPYLLQHAHNPVNWFPWSEEAFKLAQKLHRPVLLSIGYSTCHWCHVMEEESFEDEEIAQVINQNYIPIKVDREERPDIDSIYMSAVQAMTGHGGWPMTLWLTPDKKPFYGGTYFPPRDGMRGMPVGFLTLLKQLAHIYKTQPQKVNLTGKQLVQVIQENLHFKKQKTSQPTQQILDSAFSYYQKHFDPIWGGLKGAPKFPSSLPIRFLFRYFKKTHNKKALHMATLTLKQMANGGIYDHIGGGFHRYATDEKWLVPHFEKMLYDNALLIKAYIEGYIISKEEQFKQVIQQTLHYIQRDMTSPEGAFYAATDADSLTPEGKPQEGWFFTWSSKDINRALSKQEARLIHAYFSITPQGHFEGRNIFHIEKPLKTIAQQLKIPLTEAKKLLKQATNKLEEVRRKRPHPFRDEKIITAWNALMISAYAQAAFTLNEESHLKQALKAAQFLKQHLYQNKQLFHMFNDVY
ncbi:MAG: thioredoxin domain-containing protein [Bdellovibrio sp.]|nr:MAG: thioredoxin domain-containing protein [Bdellovibrio sp.]